MENIKLTGMLYIFIFVLTGCEKIDPRGFLTSYENANKRFEQSNQWNIQHGYYNINTTETSYAINVMGDSHIGGTKNFDAFIKNSQHEKVAAVVMAGDITTGNKKDYDVLEAHLPIADSLKYFAIAGNHDLYFDGWKHFYALFGPSTYYFTVNTPTHQDLFICLDTGGGTLGDLQLNWLKKILENNRNKYSFCTVITHNNLIRLRPTTSTNPMTEEIQVLLDLFLRHNVNMVITAHDHKRNTTMLGNTTHIIMDALLDGNKNAGYLKLTFNDNSYSYSFKDL